VTEFVRGVSSGRIKTEPVLAEKLPELDTTTVKCKEPGTRVVSADSFELVYV